MVHPHHPLKGQRFKLVTYRHNWGEDRVYFHDSGGLLRSIPACWTTVLPADPDASAERIRGGLAKTLRRPLAVIVSDTFGRAWREGVVNIALGVAGLQPLLDYRGTTDTHGRPLTSTVIAVADELAGAAELVMRKTALTPVAVVHGAGEWLGQGTGRMLLREASRDLFR